MPVATNLILNTKGFNSVLELPANGNYKISLQKEGFIDKVTVVEINATSDNQIIEKIVIMVPDMNPGESSIMMMWETNPPEDMDIYVAAINNDDNSICIVNFENQMCSTAAAQQTRDNAAGGNNGPETVTLTDMVTNSMFTYLLAANDYNFGNNGDDLLQSCTTFSVQNNIQSYDFQKLSASSVNSTHTFYFYGCLTFQMNGEFMATEAPAGVFFNGNIDSNWMEMKNIYC